MEKSLNSKIAESLLLSMKEDLKKLGLNGLEERVGFVIELVCRESEIEVFTQEMDEKLNSLSSRLDSLENGEDKKDYIKKIVNLEMEDFISANNIVDENFVENAIEEAMGNIDLGDFDDFESLKRKVEELDEEEIAENVIKEIKSRL